MSGPANRQPMLEGQVRSVTAAAPARGDVPWWAQSIGILALLSIVLALVAVLAVRTLAKAVSPSRQGRHMLRGLFGGGGSSRRSILSRGLLLSGVAAAFAYGHGRRERAAEHSLLLIRSAGGDVPCRYPAAPSVLPLAPGDTVQLSGRLYPDNTARAWRFQNLSTGVRHRAKIVAPWAPLAALVSLIMCLYVAATLMTVG